MKIGILSVNKDTEELNFAYPLQDYAFQQFLEKNGIQSTVLTYKPIDFNEKKGEELSARKDSRYYKFQHFMNSRCIMTEECYDSELLELRDPGFDCYISCSDHAWKPNASKKYDRGLCLASRSMDDKWKISYGACKKIGRDVGEEEEKTFLQYIEDIHAVSVKEEGLREYLGRNTGLKPADVLDPLLLHGKEFYENLLRKPREEHFLFLYSVGKDRGMAEKAAMYARSHHLKLVEMSDRACASEDLPEASDLEVLSPYDAGVEEWLGYLRYADCIFTDSPHACCLCTLFGKQVFTGLPEESPCPVPEQKRQESSDFILSAIRRMEKSSPPGRSHEWWRRTLRYPLYYSSGSWGNMAPGIYGNLAGEIRHAPDGALEFWPEEILQNDGLSRVRNNYFSRKGYLPDGWRLRFMIDRRWFLYLEDGSFVPQEDYDPGTHPGVKQFGEWARIPYLPVNGISLMAAEAVWKEEAAEYNVLYNSGSKSRLLSYRYHEADGEIQHLPTGTIEFKPLECAVNDGNTRLLGNKFRRLGYRFRGWRMRVREDRQWYWYMEDGTLKPQITYNRERDGEKYLLKDGDAIPYLPVNHMKTTVLEAVWEETKAMKLMHRADPRLLLRKAKKSEGEDHADSK